MAHDQKPIWTKVGFEQNVECLIQHGPTGPIAIRSAAGGEVISAMALFDTGAAGSAISPALAERLNLSPSGKGIIHEAGREPLSVPFFHVHVIVPGIGSWMELDVAGLKSIARPHDILIGRDVLSHFRFSIDFTEGKVVLHFRNETTE